MKNKDLYRMMVILAPIVLALYFILKPLYEGKRFPLNLGLDLVGGVRVVYQVKEGQNADKEKLSLAADIMRLRIDALGIASPSVNVLGNNRIIVEIPGVNDPEKAFDIIGDMGRLELRLVKKDSAYKHTDELTLDDLEPTFLTGDEIEKVGADLYKKGEFSIHIPRVTQEFTQKGSEAMKAATKGNIGRELAFVLNNKIIEVATIHSEISKSGQISGGMATMDDAVSLKIKLQSGSLPLELAMLTLEQIGPSLGEAIRQKGLYAASIGLLAIFGCMFAVYRLYLGLIANISLSIILALNVGLLSIAQYIFGNPIYATAGFTLTLPGIAALILTIGMSADACILFFEEMINQREESRSVPWKKMYSSVINRSWTSVKKVILDANVTTLISALIIIWLGSGTLSGFAIVMCIGIVATVYVSYFIVKELLLILWNTGEPRYYLKYLESPQFKIFTNRRILVLISVIAVVVSFGFILTKGFKIGTDFTEGTHITIRSSETLSTEKIESLFGDAGLPAIVQNIGANEMVNRKFTIKTSVLDVSQLSSIFNALKTGLNGNIEFEDTSTMGASITRKQAFKSVLVVFAALFAMLIYAAIRYNFIRGFSTVVALCHDVIVVLGVCSIFSIEMSLFAVASILTLIGYSINDSIVLLAEIKIQEVQHITAKQKSKKDLTFKELTVNEFMDRAINKIFGRSVMTAFTTLLPVIPILAMGKTGLSDFAWIIFVGVIVGAWSTLVVVAPIIKNNVDKTINPHKPEIALES